MADRDEILRMVLNRYLWDVHGVSFDLDAYDPRTFADLLANFDGQIVFAVPDSSEPERET